jgi:hypothetical protein
VTADDRVSGHAERTRRRGRRVDERDATEKLGAIVNRSEQN